MHDKQSAKTCTRCGRELPLEAFKKNAFGYTSVCKDCAKKAYNERKQESASKQQKITELQAQLEAKARTELSQFTPRELMVELRERGYQGTLTYVETKTINLERL